MRSNVMALCHICRTIDEAYYQLKEHWFICLVLLLQSTVLCGVRIGNRAASLAFLRPNLRNLVLPVVVWPEKYYLA